MDCYHPSNRPPWAENAENVVTYVIAEPCIGTKDASCASVCPVDCIYEGDDMYYINPDECIDCGACEPECPVTAIFSEDAVPEQWGTYLAKNKGFFESPAVARTRASNNRAATAGTEAGTSETASSAPQTDQPITAETPPSAPETDESP